ncbi:glycosyltransferase family A protein [Marinobacter manganoxydans]|uniref:Family 2 glycosyl transferase n=1 Tax=Marinobacter manganoxydans MnI7-9 TaxID=1094979 RepID=G6YRK9_9GAMM|nr:glycosyltransferase family A protein [Marinobacter manganoxydans]EHJ05140.1 family 2 glycosyl transferase [Marinobacter manganoxydans MnI7-9]
MTLEIHRFNELSSSQSRCLIIMPIYNRRHFLDQAFRSLGEQTYQDWNLVIVDDGSSDHPLDEVTRLVNGVYQSITYVKQSNAGPGAARATGQQFIEEQEFIAFFDSDDYWLPTYLETLIDRLEKVPEMDWVYCPCRRVDHESGVTLHESTFLDENSNQPLSFQKLDREQYGDIYLFKCNHELALTQLNTPIHAGFQNSIVRAKLASDIKIPDYRIGEDRYFLMAAITKGYRIGYVDRLGVIYNVHSNNLSDTNRNQSDIDKAVSVQNELCRSLADIRKLTNEPEIIAEATQQIADIRFWLISYNYLWRNGQAQEALSTMLSVLRQHPTNPKFIKTFLFCTLKFPFLKIFEKNI